MKNSRIFGFVVSSVLMLLMSLPAVGQSRWELKKMCRKDMKTCKKSHSGKYCRDLKKKCRQENDVTFKDDVKLFKAKVSEIVAKVVGQVSVVMGVDEENQEYMRVSFESKALGNVGDFTYSPEMISSFIEVVKGDSSDKKELGLTIYTKDMENLEIGRPLQTSDGRYFPKFIDGVKHESLFGIPFDVAGKDNYQLYLDPTANIIGAFLPVVVSGDLISKLNRFKNEELGKVGEIFPDVNSLPVTVTVDGVKVGRVAILSYDANGTNSGVVVLFDIEKLKSVAK